MPYINVIQHEEAEGNLKGIYDDLVKKRGKLAEIHKIQSLNPESIVNHMDLYMTIMFGKSPLKRYQREMIAVVVSAANKCEYCINHHGQALNNFWKDEDRVWNLAKDFTSVELDVKDLALCRYAQDLTLKPNDINESNQIHELKKNGVEERKLLDAALVIAYFNFVNRLVLGLGVQLEEEAGKGYEYD
jgi:uncharacterized peroxidase-related enzyme